MDLDEDDAENIESIFASGSARDADDSSEFEPRQGQYSSPASLADQGGHENRPSKRTSEEDNDPRETKRRKRPDINEEYVALLNFIIKDATSATDSNEPPSRPSQHGLTLWTGPEKDAFYKCLPRGAAEGPAACSGALSEKSDVEILKLEQDLKIQSYKYWSSARQDELATENAIPIAVEIGEECCNALETAADMVQSYQYSLESKVEQQRFGEKWLLTKEMASRLERELYNGDLDEEHEPGASHSIERDEIIDACGLLKLPKMLKLSREVFMNVPAPADEDAELPSWESDEEPAIFATAFSDFHNLTVNVTKRLLSATLFQAMSRLRATDIREARARKPIVRRKDVLTAIRVLSMDFNSAKFWQHAARRLKLEVYEEQRPRMQDLANTFNQKPLSLNEVERRLGVVGRRELTDNESSEDAVVHMKQSSPEIPLSRPLSMAGREHNSHAPDDFTAHVSSSHDSSCSDGEPAKEDDAENEILETFDKSKSLDEEWRLWSMLHQTPPYNIHASSSAVPPEPKIPWKNKEDPRDWRVSVDVRSEWEIYGTFTAPFSRSSSLDMGEYSSARQILRTANSPMSEGGPSLGRRRLPIRRQEQEPQDGPPISQMEVDTNGPLKDDAESQEGETSDDESETTQSTSSAASSSGGERRHDIEQRMNIVDDD